MRRSLLWISVLALAAPAAMAMTIDAKALARFDHSYVTCETKYPYMRGHRDAAYLGVWRVKADDKARGELATARKATAYQAERRRLTQPAAKAASATPASPIEHQCQALWNEAQKNITPK
jgi:hypothetical protein